MKANDLSCVFLIWFSKSLDNILSILFLFQFRLRIKRSIDSKAIGAKLPSKFSRTRVRVATFILNWMTNELISFQFSILNYHPMLLLLYVLTIEIPDVVKPSRLSSKYLLWSLSCASDLLTFSLANQQKRKTKLSLYFLLHTICSLAIIFLFMLIREKWKSKLLMWFFSI